MDLYYHKDDRGNFGDDLNTWFWDFFLPGWKSWDPAVTLIGVGTLLNRWRLDSRREARLLIVGSGSGYGPVPSPPFPASWDIRAVRGPETARSLGLPGEIGILDPAMLIPLLDEFAAIPKTGNPVFVPHVDSVARHDWAAICKAVDLTFVSPSGDSCDVIRRIAQAPLVLAESLHAAILADSFRVPWIPVSVNEEFNAQKWRDWALSLNLDLTPQPLFPQVLDFETRFPVRLLPRGRHWLKHRAERITVRKSLRRALAASPFLSQDAVLAAKRERLLTVLAGICRDYGGR